MESEVEQKAKNQASVPDTTSREKRAQWQMLADCHDAVTVMLLHLLGKGGFLLGIGSPMLGLIAKWGSMGWCQLHLTLLEGIFAQDVWSLSHYLYNQVVAPDLCNPFKLKRQKATFLQSTYACR